MKNRLFRLILSLSYLTILTVSSFSVDLKEADTAKQIQSVVVNTIKPFEKDLDVLIGGTDSFINGFMNELESLPLDQLTIAEFERHLPNFLLRVLAPKAYVTETLGRYSAVQFVRSVLLRKLCGPAILTPEQARPIKDKFNILWEKIKPILDRVDFKNDQQSIYTEIQLWIGRSKWTLEDASCINAAVYFNDNASSQTIITFEQILTDLTNLETSNADIMKKYNNIIDLTGLCNPAHDNISIEDRRELRLLNTPLILAFILDNNTNTFAESMEKRKQYAEFFKPLNERRELLDKEIHQHEMEFFGQSKLCPENNSIQEAMNRAFWAN